MTNIIFNRKNGKIVSFIISGHTGKAEAGQDVLCAAISSVAQSTAVGIVEILHYDPYLKFGDGLMELRLSQKDAENESVQILMETCLKSLKEIVKNEKKYVKLEEKNEI